MLLYFRLKLEIEKKFFVVVCKKTFSSQVAIQNFLSKAQNLICLFLNLSISPSVHLPLFLSVHLSICPSVHLSICPSVHLSICPSVHLSISPSLHLFIFLSVHLFIFSSVCLSVCPYFSLSICSSFYLSICLSVHLSVCPSVPQFIWYFHQFVLPSISPSHWQVSQSLRLSIVHSAIPVVLCTSIFRLFIHLSVCPSISFFISLSVYFLNLQSFHLPIKQCPVCLSIYLNTI